MRYNSNVLKMETSWSLYRKINFETLVNNHLGPAWRTNISKMFGYLFFSALVPQANISIPSTLIFLLLQTFEFTCHVRYCCVIRAWSNNFNPSCYLQLWIGCVHQCYTAVISFEQELVGLSSLGPGDFILRGIITFKICHMSSYGWAMVTKIVHQLKLLQLSRFNEFLHHLSRSCFFNTKWLPLSQRPPSQIIWGPRPPMVCLFSVQNITIRIKTQRSRHLHVQS